MSDRTLQIICQINLKRENEIGILILIVAYVKYSTSSPGSLSFIV